MSICLQVENCHVVANFVSVYIKFNVHVKVASLIILPQPHNQFTISHINEIVACKLYPITFIPH